MRKQLISFAQEIKFCEISSSKGKVLPQTPLLRTPLLNINNQPSKLGYLRKIQSTLRHSSSQVQKYQAAR